MYSNIFPKQSVNLMLKGSDLFQTCSHEESKNNQDAFSRVNERTVGNIQGPWTPFGPIGFPLLPDPEKK
jgi:hypothetical protein